MAKKAVIEISLVEESEEKANEAIGREILDELLKGAPLIPWCKNIEKVTVTKS